MPSSSQSKPQPAYGACERQSYPESDRRGSVRPTFHIWGQGSPARRTAQSEHVHRHATFLVRLSQRPTVTVVGRWTCFFFSDQIDNVLYNEVHPRVAPFYLARRRPQRPRPAAEEKGLHRPPPCQLPNRKTKGSCSIWQWRRQRCTGLDVRRLLHYNANPPGLNSYARTANDLIYIANVRFPNIPYEHRMTPTK